MEVSLVAAIGIGLHAFLYIGLHLQVFMDDEGAAGLNQLGVVAETLKICLFGTVDIEVVGVCGGDDTHPWAQPVEGAVELIGLNDDIVAGLGKDIVGTVVLRNTTQEGVAVDVALVHDVSAHGRRRRLAVCAGNTKSFVRARQHAKYLGALLHFKTIVAEVLQFLMLCRNGRGIDDQTRLAVTASVGNLVDILFVVNDHTFLFELLSQRRRSLVVAGHNETFMDEVAGQCTHTNATGTNEINGFYIFEFHDV